MVVSWTENKKYQQRSDVSQVQCSGSTLIVKYYEGAGKEPEVVHMARNLEVVDK